MPGFSVHTNFYPTRSLDYGNSRSTTHMTHLRCKSNWCLEMSNLALVPCCCFDDFEIFVVI